MERKPVNVVVEKDLERGYNPLISSSDDTYGVYEVEKTVMYYDDGSKEVKDTRLIRMIRKID